MHSFRPSVSKFLLDSPPGEIQPTLIEKIAKLIGTGHPDQHRRGICHHPETAFTVSEDLRFPARVFYDRGQEQKRERNREQKKLKGLDVLGRRKTAERAESPGPAPDRHQADNENRRAGAARAESDSCPQKERQRQVDKRGLSVLTEFTPIENEKAGEHETCGEHGCFCKPLPGYAAQPAASVSPPENNRRNQRDACKHIRTAPHSPDLPVAVALPTDHNHEPGVEKRAHDRRDKHREQRENGAGFEIVELEPFSDKLADTNSAEESLEGITHKPGQAHHNRHAALQLHEQMRRETAEKSGPPKPFRYYQQCRKQNRIGRPERGGGGVGESENIAEE